MTIAEIINRRKITEVLHFTTNRGLVGILATGFLKSKRLLPGEKYLEHIIHENSVVRPEEAEEFDKREDWIDYVNMSITEINSRFYNFSRRWDHNNNVWWVILSFAPVVMTHPQVYFATTNNSYSLCRRARGIAGLERLFAPVIDRKGVWQAHRGTRADNLPTCEQAEVLYPREISLDHLQKIYVRSGPDSDRVKALLRQFDYQGINVFIQPTKFIGAPN